MNKVFINRRLVAFLLLFSPILSYDVLSQSSQILVGHDTTRRVITTAVPFLLITPDARSGAMGDAGGAISPDANSIHWNPAKLAFLESEFGLSISYTPWLGNIIKDMSISYLSLYYKITREQAVGFSMRYFDLGDIFFTTDIGDPAGQFSPREFAFDLTYSRMLTENLSIGGSARFISSNLTGSFSSQAIEARPGRSFAVDFGLFYKKDFLLSGTNSNLALAAVISNIGSKVTYSSEENKDFIPANFRLGTAFTSSLNPYNTITLAVDFNKLLVPTPPIYQIDANGQRVIDQNGEPVILKGKDPDRTVLGGVFGSFGDAPDGAKEEFQEFSIATGVEYWYKELFAVRGGYFLEAENKGNRKYFTLGVGFRYQKFGLDFAYLIPQRQNHPLAETLRFTLVFNFDKAERDTESVVE
jgi:hypothetical protein